MRCTEKVKDPQTKRIRRCRNNTITGKQKCKIHSKIRTKSNKRSNKQSRGRRQKGGNTMTECVSVGGIWNSQNKTCSGCPATNNIWQMPIKPTTTPTTVPTTTLSTTGAPITQWQMPVKPQTTTIQSLKPKPEIKLTEPVMVDQVDLSQKRVSDQLNKQRLELERARNKCNSLILETEQFCRANSICLDNALSLRKMSKKGFGELENNLPMKDQKFFEELNVVLGQCRSIAESLLGKKISGPVTTTTEFTIEGSRCSNDKDCGKGYACKYQTDPATGLKRVQPVCVKGKDEGWCVIS